MLEGCPLNWGCCLANSMWKTKQTDQARGCGCNVRDANWLRALQQECAGRPTETKAQHAACPISKQTLFSKACRYRQSQAPTMDFLCARSTTLRRAVGVVFALFRSSGNGLEVRVEALVGFSQHVTHPLKLGHYTSPRSLFSWHAQSFCGRNQSKKRQGEMKAKILYLEHGRQYGRRRQAATWTGTP